MSQKTPDEVKAAEAKAKKAEAEARKSKAEDKKSLDAFYLNAAIAGVGKRGEIKKISADDAKRFGKMVRPATKEELKKANVDEK